MKNVLTRTAVTALAALGLAASGCSVVGAGDDPGSAGDAESGAGSAASAPPEEINKARYALHWPTASAPVNRWPSWSMSATRLVATP